MTDAPTNTSKMMELMTREEPLIDELQPYVVTSSFGGPMIHHPLVIEMFFDPAKCGLVNERYRQKVADLEDAKLKGKWDSYIFIHERPYRIRALLIAMRLAGDQAAINRLVRHVWVDSENIWQNKDTWISIWSGLHNPHDTMDDNEKTVYAWMPDQVTIHRGIQHRTHTPRGLSWTRDKERAVWFAHRYRSKRHQPTVLDAFVKKQHILAYFNGRNEEEIVVLPRHIKMIRK